MKRQEIITELIYRLKEIKVSNGYLSDAGANVYEWLQRPLTQGDDLPAIILRDTDDNVEQGSYNATHKLKIEIDVVASHKELTIEHLREVVSDVIKNIGQTCEGESDESLNLTCVYQGSEIHAEHAERLFGGARLTFVIQYESDKWSA